MGKFSANIFYQSAISFIIMFGIVVVILATMTPQTLHDLLQTVIQKIQLIIIHLIHGDFENIFTNN